MARATAFKGLPRTAPDYIQFYPTLHCNRACDFCFNRSLPSMADMSLAAFREMLDRLCQLGVSTLDIIGGEPTLHPEIREILDETQCCSLKVNISTNGSNLEVLRDIGHARGVTVGISINDRGTFNRLSDFIQRSRPVVKTVCVKSLDEKLIADILDLGPALFYLIYHDAMEPQDLAQSIPFPEFLDKAAALSVTRPVGMVYCSGFLPDTKTYPELASVRCPAGTTKLAVLPDGSVYPCNLLFGRPEFLLGNILTDPFEKIWQSPLLGFFRNYSDNSCPKTQCELHADCHGGCPAQALLLRGNLSAPDPRCFPL